MIEEFCYGDSAQIVNILGEKLSNQLRGKEFEDALKEYLEDKEFEDALN